MDAAEGKKERVLWPEWCSEHPWLSNFLSTVEEEARERSDRAVEDFHFSLALTRDEGAGDLLNHLGFDPRRLRDRINVRLGANAGILLERSGTTSATIESKTLDELYWEGPLQLTQQARDTLAVARIEADKHGERVGPGHVLAGLSRRSRPFGVSLARIRRASGIPHEPRILARGVDRGSIRKPLGVGPLVLGGGDELEKVASKVVQLASNQTSNSPEAVVVVGLFPAALSSVDSMPETARLEIMKPFAAAGAMIFDSGLSFRSEAARPEIVDRLSRANVIYLSFGRPELLLDAVLGTPAYDALVGASDRGAIVMGSSAGSIILGCGMLSDYESQDDEEPLPLFNWIDQSVVFPHYMRGAESALRNWMAAFPGSRGIGVAHQGAVLVERGWRSFRILVMGVDEGSVILDTFDGELKAIGNRMRDVFDAG